MINVKKLKVIPITKQVGRFDTPSKDYKKLIVFTLIFLFISSYLTATSFGKNIEEDRINVKEVISNYTTIK